MSTMDGKNSEYHLPGWFYHFVIVLSALLFTVSSLLAKVAINEGAAPFTITFFRFSIGLIVLSVYILMSKSEIRPTNVRIIILRGVFNMTAVGFFYWSVQYTTITNANLLNMTYPVFVALLSPILLREHLKIRDWIMLMIAGIGIYLVINPNFNEVNFGDILGLCCGLAAGFAVVMLRKARRDNQTVTVLFIMLLTGTVLSWPAVLFEEFGKYTPYLWSIVLGCGVMGVMGQFAITSAFKHVTAFAGSVTSTSRVIMAACVGAMFLSEIPPWHVVVGAVIIITAICLRKSQ